MIKGVPNESKVKQTLTAGKIYTDGTYLENNTTWHVEDSPWKANQIFKILSRNKVSPQTVCEIGCGAGEILKQLSEKLPTTSFHGYEISPQAFELCKLRESVRVQYTNRSLLDEDAFFDVALCIDVFEHVDDYIGFVTKLKSKADFKIFHIPLDISVLSVLGEGMMKARKSVGHLHYFTPTTAIATLNDAGYEVLDSFFTTGFNDLPNKTFKAKMAIFPRKMLYALSPRMMVKLVGGCSLMVLAK